MDSSTCSAVLLPAMGQTSAGASTQPLAKPLRTSSVEETSSVSLAQVRSVLFHTKNCANAFRYYSHILIILKRVDDTIDDDPVNPIREHCNQGLSKQ